jgi:hypothetical protein
LQKDSVGGRLPAESFLVTHLLGLLIPIIKETAGLIKYPLSYIEYSLKGILKPVSHLYAIEQKKL